MARKWRYKLSEVVGLAVVGVVASACGSQQHPQGNAQALTNSDAVGTSVVSGMGEVLVDSAGKTLYFTDSDHGGTVACTDGCTSVWRPVFATGTRAPDGSTPGVTVVRRSDDGREQLAYHGRPLYEFTADSMAGQVTGNGIHDGFGGRMFSWHVALVTGTSTTGNGGGNGGGISGY